MGQTEGKDNNQLQLLYQEFTLVRRFSEEGIYGEGSLLQSKNDPTVRVFLKEINLTDEFQFNKALRKFDNRAKLSHPNVLNLIKHFHIHESQLCGQFFRLYLVFEYLDFSLIEFQQQKFQEQDLWNYLTGSVSALAFFQQQQLRHDNINLSTIYLNQNDGTVKIADSSILKPINMFTQVLQRSQQTAGLYLSPILVKAISQNNWQPKHNSYKSDVFSLGMTFLHLSLKESLDSCYKYQEGVFREDILQQKIQQMQQRYTGNISKVIIQMLFVQEQQRPDFIQLLELISNSPQHTPHFQNPPQNQGLSAPFQLSQQSTQQLVQPTLSTPSISQKQTPTHSQEHSMPFNQSVSSLQEQQEQFQNPFRQFDKPVQRKNSISSQQSQQKNQEYTHSTNITLGRQNVPSYIQGPVNESINNNQQQFPLNSGSRLSQNSLYQQYQNNGLNPSTVEDFSQRTQQKPFQQAFDPQPYQMVNNYKEITPLNRTYQELRPNNQDLRINSMMKTNNPENFRENSNQKYQQNSTKSQNTQMMFPNQSYQQPIMPQTQLYSDSPFLLGADQSDYLFPIKFFQPKISSISYPDENIDPSGDLDQLKETKQYQNNDNLLRLSKAHEFQPQQGFNPLQDYTNLFQIKDQGNESQKKQAFEDSSQKNQSYVNRYQNQGNSQIPYQKKDQFSVPFDLPNNFNSYGYNSVDQELQQEVQRSIQKQQIQDQGRPPVHNTQYYKPQQQLEFLIEQYPNGSRYEGEKLNGMRHGQGKFSYSDGGVYDGQWKENKMHGKGILYYASGKPAYDGDWQEDQFQGQGTLYNETPFQLNYEFDFRDFDNVEDYWVKYQGQFNDDNKEGQGTLFLTNGEKFVGFFSKDFINGPGKFYTMSQRMFEGRWVNNKLVQ